MTLLKYSDILGAEAMGALLWMCRPLGTPYFMVMETSQKTVDAEARRTHAFFCQFIALASKRQCKHQASD